MEVAKGICALLPQGVIAVMGVGIDLALNDICGNAVSFINTNWKWLQETYFMILKKMQGGARRSSWKSTSDACGSSGLHE